MIDEPVNRRWGVRWSPEINTGQVVQAVVVAICSVVVGAVYLNTYTNQVDATKRDVASLKTDLVFQVASLRTDMGTQFMAIQTNNTEAFRRVLADIANLPDVRATLGQVERRLDQGDSRLDAQSKRLESVQAVGIQNSADIVNVLRIMGAKK